MRKRAFLFILAGMLLIPGMASALSIANIGSGTIQLGDKIFGDFSVSGPIAPSAVNVLDFTVGDNVVIGFQGGFSSGLGGDVDYAIFYSVTATGGRLIESIDQAFNLTGTGDGGIVGIGETVWSTGFFTGAVVAQSSVGFAVTGDYIDPPGEVVQGDQLIIDPALVKVWVTKDIEATAANSQSAAGATIITQSFHQTAVPEPATMFLLGCGLVGLAGLSRKFKK